MLVSHEYIDDLACLITILLVGSHGDIAPTMIQIKTIGNPRFDLIRTFVLYMLYRHTVRSFNHLKETSTRHRKESPKMQIHIPLDV
jgi:hypothetical protein